MRVWHTTGLNSVLIENLFEMHHARCSDNCHHNFDVFGRKPRAFGEVTFSGFTPIPPTRAEEHLYFVNQKFIQLVDRPERCESPSGILLTNKSNRFKHPIENLAIIHLDDVVAP